MALTRNVHAAVTTANGASAAITNASVTCATGDLLTAVVSCADAQQVATATMSNNGTAITWALEQSQTGAGNGDIRRYQGIVGATPPTSVTFTANTGNDTGISKCMAIIAETGQHATTPTPNGNYFTGVDGADVTRSITPTSAGSDLWFFGVDWNDTNTFDPATNCTLDIDARVTGMATWCLSRPTTQPRTDTSAFSVGEADTGAKVAWVAWEVQAAAGGGGAALSGSALTGSAGTTTPSGVGTVGGSALTPGLGTGAPGIAVPL